MARGKGLPPTKRAQIVALKNLNISNRKIALQLNVSEGTVRDTMKRYDGTPDSLNDRRRSGRPRKSTIIQDRHLKILCKRNRFLSSAGLQTLWKSSGGPSVHSSTVRRRLIAEGLYLRGFH